jgi:anti-sigma regulatory factor (Ser/Thr protein kinase)
VKTFHIEYVVHIYVEAEDSDTARELGSEQLSEMDFANQLHNECEFIAIEDEEEL